MRTLQCSTCGTTTFAPDQPTLRDRFAMAALQGLIAAPWHPEMGFAPQSNRDIDIVANADTSYRYADAMLAARTRPADRGSSDG